METQILIRGEGKTQHSMYLSFRILLAGDNLKIDFAGLKIGQVVEKNVF